MDSGMNWEETMKWKTNRACQQFEYSWHQGTIIIICFKVFECGRTQELSSKHSCKKDVLRAIIQDFVMELSQQTRERNK